MIKSTIKTLLKVLFAPLLWLLQGCSPLGDPVKEEKSENHYYNNNKTDILFSPMGNWFELGKSPMKADVTTFEVLSDYISKDKNRAYFQAEPINSKLVDLSTFKAYDDGSMMNIARDKKHVYVIEKIYGNPKNSVRVTAIKGANPETFEITDLNWSNDGQNHFYRNKMVPVDFKSFEILNEYFSKDNFRGYYHYNDIFDSVTIDVETFKAPNSENYALDKNHVYTLRFSQDESPATTIVKIPRQPNEKIIALSDIFLRIGDKVFSLGHPLEDVDVDSFEIVQSFYAKDKNHVYYKDKLIPNAHSATFKRMEKGRVGDENGIFQDGNRLMEAASSQ